MEQHSGNQLRKESVGVTHIVFFVVAAAAPLTVVVGVSPAAFAFGNGPGVPGVYLMVGLLYLFFSVGFTAMNRFINGAGGFYSYISNGLGRSVGVGGAFIALATYFAAIVSIYGLFGFFLNAMVRSAGGPEIHWLVYCMVLSIAVYFCGVRKIEFSGNVLGFCMVAEISILALLGIAVLMSGGGPEGISVAPFGSKAIFSPGLGVSLVFVVASFIGFEATAIFGAEAKNPAKTIPRATYIAVLIIAIFYGFVTWAISLHYGPSKITEAAAQHAATMYFTAVQAKLGRTAGVIMNVLLVTSVFACALSFHNTLNRYLYSIGCEGIAWSGFAITHRDHQSPYVAGIVQTVLVLGITAAFAAAGQDPYAVVFSWTSTFAALGILILQIVVSMAVIAFFLRDNRGLTIWRWLIAPVIGMLGLGACLALMTAHLSLVSGSESLIVDAFPVIIVLVGCFGYAFANRLRSTSPSVYENLGRPFS